MSLVPNYLGAAVRLEDNEAFRMKVDEDLDRRNG